MKPEDYREFRLTAYENVSDNRFFDAKAGDAVMRVAPVRLGGTRPERSNFRVTAQTVEDALETLWHIGNKQPRWSDDGGYIWPADRRSMSVSDVVTVEGVGTFKVASVGWESTGDDVFPVVTEDPRLGLKIGVDG